MKNRNSPVLKVAVVDCKDSFVYNLVELLRYESRCSFDVLQIAHLTSEVARQGAVGIVRRYHALLLSPGPGLPQEQAILSDLILAAEGHCTILGVCLGLQAIAVAYGARLQQLERPLHGHEDYLQILAPEDLLLKGIPEAAPIGRYHSWVVARDTLPLELQVTATSGEDGSIMALRHRKFPFYGLQFHPESFISSHGQRYISNWIALSLHYQSHFPT